MKKNSKTLRICYIAIFTAIICVISQLPGIPLPGGVPMTLQTLVIPLAGLILGPLDGFVATLLYILLGIVGLPVFSGFTGGIGIVMGATGGFIVSFPLMALFAGLGDRLGEKVGEKSGDKSRKKAVYYVSLYAGLVLGAVINYVVGTLWFAKIYVGAINSENMAAGFAACVLPFIPTSIIKIVLAGIIGLTIKRALRKAGLLK
ncbi:MAG: biotin transporter BioY [Lachnospiraceae bacterium]|nr:biotin transporter BioY [Lachnospiraceae bacterium]